MGGGEEIRGWNNCPVVKIIHCRESGFGSHTQKVVGSLLYKTPVPGETLPSSDFLWTATTYMLHRLICRQTHRHVRTHTFKKRNKEKEKVRSFENFLTADLIGRKSYDLKACLDILHLILFLLALPVFVLQLHILVDVLFCFCYKLLIFVKQGLVTQT